MGTPGAGKGTLASGLRALRIEHFSSGELFRQEIESRTPLGRSIEASMERGELVSDEETLRLVRQWFWSRPSSRGFLLDGFPRTLPQAVAFDEWLDARQESLTGCLLLELPEEETVQRLTGRRVCPQDGRVYHLESDPPVKEGVCEDCGAKLVRREDDEESVVRHRYELYRESSRPLIEHYHHQGLLWRFSGDVKPEELVGRVYKAFHLTPIEA
jgi:adenylate kinase